MKKLVLFGFSILTAAVFAQNKPTFNWAIEADTMYVTPPLRDIPINLDLFPDEVKEHVYSNKMRRHKFVNEDALPEGNDPMWQDEPGYTPIKAPIENWEGINSNLGFPPDPSGDAGPNHYVQMVNSFFEVFDKQGNSIYGPNSLSSVLNSNLGDPIVMYDRHIDRWFISAIGGFSSITVALSNTSDPTGTYTVWTYSLGSLPDYPKYGIWHDGYYMTANTNGPDCLVFERSEMILGASGNPQLISMTIPSLNDGSGTQTGGFHSVLPAYADFTLPQATDNLHLFYFQDDAWNGVSQDEIKIWEVDINWNNIPSSTVNLVQNLAVAPFDSQFNVNWNDITQPGTNQKLDGVPGAFMYRAQYTQWPNHNTVMLNHTVDVSATNHAGIRWYELRETNGIWSVYQQSTYAPDNKSRWLGSISMDNQGNIALAYSVAGSSTSASLMYTGRYANDPINSMTLTEDTIVIGSGAQTNGNRYGDYAHMSVDPDDDQTFWYTGEYIDGTRSTRIASFKFANSLADDVGVTALVTPIDGILTANETVEITITNFGSVSQNNFQVGYQIGSNAPVLETYNGGLIASGATANYQFVQTADLSAFGDYDFTCYTALANDGDLLNDTIHTTVTHVYTNDVGVSIINSPSDDNNLMMETVSVTLENYGSVDQSNFDVAYTINGGTPVVETYTSTLTAGTTGNYNFATQGDFTSLGIYDIKAYSILTGDMNVSNDTSGTNIENTNCAPASDCSFDDGITTFQLGTINNPSGCTPGGYSDYSVLSTDLLVGNGHNLTVATNGGIQYVSVWIDVNDNFFFEASEQVVANFVINNSGNTIIAIDANANLGSHLLRAKASDQSSDVNDPCSDMQYGETQDYTVNFVSDAAIENNETNRNTILVQSLGNGRFILSAEHFESEATLTIHNALGQLMTTSSITIEDLMQIHVDLSGYAQGAYLVHLKTANQSGVVKLSN